MSTDGAGTSAIRVLNAVVATPEATGGAVRAGLQLGDHLRAHVDVDNAKMRGADDASLLDELGLDGSVHPLPSRTIFRDLSDRIVDFGGNYANALVWTTADAPRPLPEYDLVHLHNPHPITGLASLALAARRAGVPYVVTAHGVGKLPELPAAMGMSRPARIVFRTLQLRPYWRIFRGAAHLFALSPGDRDRIHRRLPGHSVSVVPNGVDPTRPNDGAAGRLVEEFGIDPDEPVLLYAGDLVESKGIDDLLAAHGLLADRPRLVVAGRDRSGYADAIADQAGVDYVGYVDRPTLLDLYRRADLFVFPTRADVFPLSVLEAMAAGTPVVASAVGGIPEQLGAATKARDPPSSEGEAEAGILVPSRSPDRVADAVEWILSNPDRRREIGELARQRVRREYAWPAVAERVADEYGRILV